MITVVDVNANVPLADRQRYAAAQQRQLAEHFAPLWRFGADTVQAATPKSGDIQVQLLANAPDNGALGVHERLADGTPVAYVYVGLAQKFGTPWQSVASHEVLELTADPFGHLAVIMADGFWDREVADRVEQNTYFIDGVPMSNFNTPACFEPANVAGEIYDFLKKSTKPNEVRPGGYAQRFDSKQGWMMIQNGMMSPYRAHMLAHGLGRVSRKPAPVPPTSWLKRLIARAQLASATR